MSRFSHKHFLLFIAFFVLWHGQANAQSYFTCGPYMFTYEAWSSDGRVFSGIRCVKVVDDGAFAWYGEGRWGWTTYKHLGYAIGGGSNFRGWSADIYGNGESATGRVDGSLSLSPTANMSSGPNVIWVGGAWSEKWVRRNQVYGYVRLPGPVTRCGGNFEQLYVSTPDGTHVRCLLTANGKSPAAWYGEGAWNGIHYIHVGTAFFGIFGTWWGASDLCRASGDYCGVVSYGGLDLQRWYSTIKVTGTWNEWWVP